MAFLPRALVLLVWFAVVFAEEPKVSALPPAEAPIRLTNYKEGEVLRHPVPLLRGALRDRKSVV